MTVKSYKSFEEARAFVHRLGLRSVKEWMIYCKNGKKLEDIPTNPAIIFKNLGWISWGDWLGTGRIAKQYREYRQFAEAREFVNKLRLKNHEEWKKYCNSGEKPADIPATPGWIYKDWINWTDWLGTDPLAHLSIKHIKPISNEWIGKNDEKEHINWDNCPDIKEKYNYYLIRIVLTAIEILANFTLRNLLNEKSDKKFYDIINMNNCLDKIALDAISLFERYEKNKGNKKTNICRLIDFFNEANDSLTLNNVKINNDDELINLFCKKVDIHNQEFIEKIEKAKKYRDRDVAHKDYQEKLQEVFHPYTEILAKCTYSVFKLLHDNQHIIPNNSYALFCVNKYNLETFYSCTEGLRRELNLPAVNIDFVAVLDN